MVPNFCEKLDTLWPQSYSAGPLYGWGPGGVHMRLLWAQSVSWTTFCGSDKSQHVLYGTTVAPSRSCFVLTLVDCDVG